MIILGYSLALLMGLTLGLIGAGGSIITLPLLIYVFGLKPSEATLASLLIVGATSAFGAFRYAIKRLINYKALAIFALPSIISVSVTRSFIVPKLPMYIGQVAVDKLIVISFALLMMVIAIMMLKPNAERKNIPKLWKLIAMSISVGLITGLLGAGGGFLIIPVLTLFFKLDMKNAIATSLSIIALNSLFGVFNAYYSGFSIDLTLILPILGITLTGMFIGVWLAPYCDNNKLKIIFASFTLLLGGILFVYETLSILGLLK